MLVLEKSIQEATTLNTSSLIKKQSLQKELATKKEPRKNLKKRSVKFNVCEDSAESVKLEKCIKVKCIYMLSARQAILLTAKPDLVLKLWLTF